MATSLPVDPHPDVSQCALCSALCGIPGGHAVSTDPVDEPLHAIHEKTSARLAAIEEHVHQIETRLGAIGEFNGRLDEIHATLETVIGFVATDRVNESLSESSNHVDHSTTETGFRVVAHVSRDSGGTRLIPDVSWPDTWSVRLFVTALLRNLASNDRAQERRCWCEIWTPNETGERVDSAILNPETGIIEWESDLGRETPPLFLESGS